ncbi:MAG TPA: PKD domain-containing protein [Taishania sp.]|nr:PKD domain-containing protein [Taishania sp.]
MKYAIVLLATLLFTLPSCKKERPIGQSSKLFDVGFSIRSSTNPLFSPFVSYNSSYGVLVFNSLDDLHDLVQVLETYDSNFPFNRERSAEILSMISAIETHGYTLESNSTNEIFIDDFQELLMDAFPLSDEILLAIIDLNESPNLSQGHLPYNFMEEVFVQNCGLSLTVENSLLSSNLPVDSKNLIVYGDQNFKERNYAFEDFYNSIDGFDSYYEMVQNTNASNLQNGMDPADPQFDRFEIDHEFLQLFMNVNREVYIDGYLFKVFNECRLSIIKGALPDAYASANMLDGNGLITPPTGITELETGLSVATMNNYIPLNYAAASIESTVIQDNGEGNLFARPAKYLEKREDPCPRSLFSFDRDQSDALTIEFDSYTNLAYNGGTFYQYWLFGDGTGSFQPDPTHTYANAGTYTVKLITFNAQCGCWDVAEVNMGIGYSTKACYISNFQMLPTTTAGQYNFSASASEDNNSAIQTIIWDFGDGTTSSGSLTTSHQYTQSGIFDVTLIVHFTNLCYTSYTQQVTGISAVACCDVKDKEKEVTKSVFDDDKLKFKMKDKAYGELNGIGQLFDEKIKAKQTFYKKSFGVWFPKKADIHDLRISGKIYALDIEGGCLSTATDIPFTQGFAQNKTHVTKNLTVADNYGLQKNSVKIEHKLFYNNQSHDENIKLGDCP